MNTIIRLNVHTISTVSRSAVLTVDRRMSVLHMNSSVESDVLSSSNLSAKRSMYSPADVTVWRTSKRRWISADNCRWMAFMAITWLTVAFFCSGFNPYLPATSSTITAGRVFGRRLTVLASWRGVNRRRRVTVDGATVVLGTAVMAGTVRRWIFWHPGLLSLLCFLMHALVYGSVDVCDRPTVLGGKSGMSGTG